MKNAILSKLKSKSFWSAVAGAISLILNKFGIFGGGEIAETIITFIGCAFMLGGIALLPINVQKEQGEAIDDSLSSQNGQEQQAPCNNTQNKEKPE